MNEPLRAGPMFGSTVKLTLPLPLPVEPVTTVIQEVVLCAVQAHPAAAMTVIGEPVMPAAPTVWLIGLTEYKQPPFWLMVTGWPATVSVPIRAEPGLVATLKATVPV